MSNEKSENINPVDVSENNTTVSDSITSETVETLQKLNEETNKESEKILQQTDALVKKQEETLQSPTFITEPQYSETVPQKSNKLRNLENKSPIKREKSISPSLRKSGVRESIIKEIIKVQNHQEEPDDDLDEAAKQMEPEERLNFYKARCKLLERELACMIEELKEKNHKLFQHESALRDIKTENKKLYSVHQSFRLKCERLRKEVESEMQKYNEAKLETEKLKKELEQLRKDLKKTENADKTKGLRLLRAIEEKEKIKQEIDETQKQKSTNVEFLRKENMRLSRENTQLVKQKQELLHAFKKQQKLIDILKRQKSHIENAEVLGFTESEFKKTIDLKQ